MPYAVFDFGPGVTEDDLLAAKHEAAHAVVTWRLGVPVHKITISADGGHDSLQGHTICDWEGLHGTKDDFELCKTGFAIAYAGIALEMQTTGADYYEISNALPTDLNEVAATRRRLIEWQPLSPEADRREVSKGGYNLAHSLVTREMSRIERLAQALLIQRVFEGDAIQEWFAKDVSAFGVDPSGSDT